MDGERNKQYISKIYNREQLKEAAEALKLGKLVAFPTETVFGLGAIANNEAAVAKVFETKNRPADNPLIVHVHRIDVVKDYVKEVNPTAQLLMEAFWPGPLTIIFPTKDEQFAPSVTPNKKTVGIRMPNQLETLLLIEMTGFPIVGPSANLSGKPSPTTVEHVLHDLDGKIEGVVDNYSPFTEVGVESTVVLPQDNQIIILRPGAITKEMLEEKTKLKVIERTADEQIHDKEGISSPGTKYRHYSPNQPVYMVKYDSSIERWKEIVTSETRRIGVLAQQHILEGLENLSQIESQFSLGHEENIHDATQRLFAGLRYLEASDCEVIYVQTFKESQFTHAFLNRLTKAAIDVL